MGKREEFGRGFIYFILIIWFGTEVLFSSTLENIFIWKTKEVNDVISIVILVLLIMQIVFLQKYQFRELILIGAFSLPIIIATLNSGNNRIMSTWIFVIAAKYIDFDRIIKAAYYVELAMTLLVLYFFRIGFITEFTMYRGDTLRHSLGFTHPNQLGIRVFLLIVCRCYIRRRRFNFFDWGIIVAAALFIKRVAYSKTSFYALIILAVLMSMHMIVQMMGGNLGKLSNAMIMLAAMANAVSVLFSFIQVKHYPYLSRFDVFMSRRFSECHKTMNYYGVKLLGQNIKLIVPRPILGRIYHFWLDNAYMSMLLRYGVVVYFIISILYLRTMILLKRTNQYILVAILCLYSIYGIMENNFYSMSQNLFLLLLSYPIYKHESLSSENEARSPRLVITW